MESLRIVSDGTRLGTQLLLPDGQSLPARVTKIVWSLEAGTGRLSEVCVTFVGLPLELTSESATKIEPDAWTARWLLDT